MNFTSIREIVDHIRGKYPQMVWVGKEYSIADLIADLERLEGEMQNEIEKTRAVLERITNKPLPPPPARVPLIYTLKKGA